MKAHCITLLLLLGLSIPVRAADVDLPAADATTTVEKLNLGPTKLYVQWTGKAKDFRFFRVNQSYYTAEDFSFTLETEKDGTWPVISREPTPFETWRFGTTFTGLDVDWTKEPQGARRRRQGHRPPAGEVPGLQARSGQDPDGADRRSTGRRALAAVVHQ